jgi:diguanylate cyclase (GGDEF)-like protein
MQYPALISLLGIGFALIAAPSGVSAQATDPSTGPYLLRTWQVEEGLPHNHIDALAQTRDGYLWLATHMVGLTRFDGARFVVLGKDDPQVAPLYAGGNEICVLLCGRGGELWVGTTQAGVWRLRGPRAEQFAATAHGLPSDRILALCEGRDGSLWIGTDNGLACVRCGEVETFGSAGTPPEVAINALLEDREGTLWIGTTGQGLWSYTRRQFSTVMASPDGLAHDFVTALAEAPDGSLWVGTQWGLSRYRDGRFSTLREPEGLATPHVLALMADPQGTLWVGTSAGLFRGAPQSREVRPSLALERLTRISTPNLVLDREGSLWSASQTGLARYRHRRMTTYARDEGLAEPAVFSVRDARGGGLWVCSAGGLYRLRGGRFTVPDTIASLPRVPMTSLQESADGTLWVGSWGHGVFRVKDGKVVTFMAPSTLGGNVVRSVLEDRAGDLWFGTFDGGLTRLHDGRFTTYTTRDGLPHNSIRVLHQDRRGDLWIATTNGLSRLHDGAFTNYTERQGLTAASINALHEDDDGTLWVGTFGGGLCRLRDGILTSFRASDGLSSDAIFQILDDGAGHLWLGTSRGIVRVARRDLESFAAGALPVVPSAYYGKVDGMRSSQCSGGCLPAGWRSREGTLWFATMDGMVSLDPHTIGGVEPAPVLIEQVAVNGKPAALKADTLELPPGHRDLEFQFTTSTFVAPERVRFFYKLEGYDRDWIDCGTRRSAFYTNIPPGSYRFRVRACNHEGAWSETVAGLGLLLKPYYYETGWFASLCVLGMALTGLGLYRLRMASLRRQHQELERLVHVRTGELLAAHTALESQNRKLAELATTDSLTGLKNRRAFYEALESAAALAARRVMPLSVAMIDVDRFKLYNDQFGHPAGDDVLRTVARILRSEVREHDLAARHGGEEFVVLLTGADAAASRVFAERLRAAFAAYSWPLRPVTISLGLATFGDEYDDPTELVNHADVALYESKHRGRNRSTHHEDLVRSGQPELVGTL